MGSVNYNTWINDNRELKEIIRTIKSHVQTLGPGETALIEGDYGARRREAIMSYTDRAEEDFWKFGEESTRALFAQNELIPTRGYNDLDENAEIRLGAAIWILEKLKARGKIRDACEILPDMLYSNDDPYIQWDFHHPCFDNYLIQAVVRVLSLRYLKGKEEGFLINEGSVGRQKVRRDYAHLLSMLSEEDIRSACDTFKKKQWEIVSIYLQSRTYHDTVQHDFIKKTDPRSSITFTSDADTVAVSTKRIKIEEECLNLAQNFDDYLQMGKTEKKRIREEIGNGRLAAAFTKFTVKDPYELCFALIYLLDTGDDAPWLLTSGTSLMLYTVKMLPWYVETKDGDGAACHEEGRNEKEMEKGGPGPLTYDRNGWLDKVPPEEQPDYYHEKHGGKNLAQIIYSLCGGIVPVGMHPFEEDRLRLISEWMEEEKARKVTEMADILFLSYFRSGRHEPDFVNEMPLPLRDPGREDAEEKEETKRAEDEATAAAREIARLQEENRALKREVKSLNGALAESRQEAEKEKDRSEKELTALRMEHRELADLRELVFNREGEETGQSGKAGEKIAYPYSTRRRTVVFGGHDSFLKVIRPMLPTVRFVPAETLSFSQDIIRNADVVWIQCNRISHSQYSTIVKQCRLSGVQMRYFTFASAEKCAEQLVREDAGDMPGGRR